MAKASLTDKAKSRLINAMASQVRNETTMRREWLTRAFGGRKDINDECDYPDVISIEDYRRLYDREGYATRVVDILPDETWQSRPVISETDEADETKFEAAWKELDDDLGINQYMHRVDKLSGVGEFGVLLLGIDDGEDLNIPVEGINLQTGQRVGGTERKLLYLRPLDQSIVTIQLKEGDKNSPRFGRPVLYKVQFQNTENRKQAAVIKGNVHWTRILHVADNRGVDETYGVPRMKKVFNRLLDLRKVLAASGEMFWKGGFPGYVAEMDPNLAPAILENNQIEATIRKNLKEEIELWQNSLQPILSVAGMKIKSLQPQVSDPGPHVKVELQIIALALGIPWRIFLGSEEAKLASSEDKKSWNGRLHNRQEFYVTPMIIRPLIDRLIALSVLPEPKEYSVVWPDLNIVTEKEAADVAKVRTDAMARFVQGDLATIIAPLEFLTQVMGFDQEAAEAMIKSAGLLETDEDEV